MKHENRITFSGVVCDPPRYNPSAGVLNLNLRNTYEAKNGAEYTTYIRVAGWGSAAAIGDKVAEGDTVLCVGRLKKGKKWTDRDGNERDGGYEINAFELDIIDAGGAPLTASPAPTVGSTDDIPF